MAKNGDLVQLKYSKEIGIVIDDFSNEILLYYKANNIKDYSCNIRRKILVFKESGPEIDFVPNFNITLIKDSKDTRTL